MVIGKPGIRRPPRTAGRRKVRAAFSEFSGAGLADVGIANGLFVADGQHGGRGRSRRDNTARPSLLFIRARNPRSWRAYDYSVGMFSWAWGPSVKRTTRGSEGAPALLMAF